MPHRFLVLTMILALVLGACSSDGADTDSSPETTVTTTSAPTTTTAAATPQELVLTFDGDQCTYAGPSVGDLSQPFSLTLVNDSDVTTIGTVHWVPEYSVDAAMAMVGTDFRVPGAGSIPGLAQILTVDASSGDEQTVGDVSLPAPGTYLLDCVAADGADGFHVWRPVAFEVS